MRLSEHFMLSEFTRSGTAERLGIDNTPPEVVVGCLQSLVKNVLEPVRVFYNRPVSIISGYRSPALNKAVGGEPTSQHLFGQAADFEVPSVPNADVVRWIKANLKFDQLIAEVLKEHDGSAGWIHCSWRDGANRNELISFLGKNRNPRYVPGLVFA